MGNMRATLSLPPIALDSLPEATKDYILGLCNGADLTPEQAVRRVLNGAARPFLPSGQADAAQPEATANAAMVA